MRQQDLAYATRMPQSVHEVTTASALAGALASLSLCKMTLFTLI